MPETLEDLTTDQLLARARAMEGNDAMFRALLTNPETRSTIQRAVKKLNPSLVIPEIDAKDSVLAELAAEREARLKFENEVRERELRRSISAEKTGVQSKYQLTDADMLAVEKLMLDEQHPISTYDAAARVHLASKKPATPTPAALVPPTYTMPEKEVWGAGIGNPAKLNRIALEEAYGAWNEIMGGKVEGLGTARAAAR
jgi:hypothetical protein